jgi:hypothetical protein
LVFFAIFIPFSSNLPDGLEKVVETFEVEEQNNGWNGIMGDYLINTINNPVSSTFSSGIIGIFMVLITALFLGKALETKKYDKIPK